jgi:L-asparagine oxygenase
MKVFPRSELPADISAKPYEDPLGVCETARALVGTSFVATDREILARVEDFSAPYVVAVDAFNASDIEVPTPSSFIPPIPESGRAFAAMLNLIVAAGLRPLSYIYENEGALAVNLSPKRLDSEDKLALEKSTKDLSGHTDASFNPSSAEFVAGDSRFSPAPDFVVLAGIRNPARVATRIALLSDVLPLLSEEDRAELQQPNFILTPQSSFVLPDDAVRYGPVLWRDSGDQWCCRFSHSKIAADPSLHPGAISALARVSEVLRAVSKAIVIAPGEILLFNNRTIIHGREKIGDWNPTARWLLRMYANRPSTPVNELDADRSWIVN